MDFFQSLTYPQWALLVFVAWVVISIYALDKTMVYFLAVMRIRTMRDTGAISPSKTPFLWVYCMFVLARGLLCDLWVQLFVCTVVGLELPPRYWRVWQSKRYSWLRLHYFTIEWLTTERLIRWNKSPAQGWWTIHIKKEFVQFGKIMLNPSDTTGQHVTN
jgi:hypothetical protein